MENRGSDKDIDVGTPAAKLFVPFSEELLERIGSPLGELVPFHLEYQCVRLLDNGDEEVIDAETVERELACIAANS
jgi:hypothetical protein